MHWENNELKKIMNFITNNISREDFGNVVNEYLYKKNITTSMLCKNAGIDRRLLSKFVGKQNYHPSKDTAMAICIGLGLNSNEARDILSLSGYSFANNSRRDLAVLYALDSKKYCNITEVNKLILYLGERPFKNRFGN